VTTGDDPCPSDWVRRWEHLLGSGTRVLDVACGTGRHARWLAAAGHRVTAIDRDAQAIAALREVPGVVQAIVADLEDGPWPLPDATFDAVLVTNYLWRPLWPPLLAAVASGGLWLHETFNQSQASLGRPRRPEFLLAAGELLAVAGHAGLQVVAYEEGRLPGTGDAPGREVQRIVARRRTGPSTPIDWLEAGQQ